MKIFSRSIGRSWGGWEEKLRMLSRILHWVTMYMITGPLAWWYHF